MESKKDTKHTIIILGGSSFMGLTFLNEIAANIDFFQKVYIINRGRKYWDGKSEEIMQKYSNVFVHIKQDRNKRKQFMQKMKEIFEQND